MNLADWASGLFAVVEQDGATTARVKLITPINGDIWHTWFAPFPSPHDWEPLAESVLRSLEQNSSGAVQVSFVAETAAGEVISQLPWRIRGKLQSGGLESAQQAAASVFASLTQTMERTNELANRQLDQAAKSLEKTMEMVNQQMSLINAYRERDMLVSEEQQTSPVMQVLQAYGPQLAALAELGMTLIQTRVQQQARQSLPPQGDKPPSSPPPAPAQPSPQPPPPTAPKGTPRKVKRNVPPTDTVKRRR